MKSLMFNSLSILQSGDSDQHHHANSQTWYLMRAQLIAKLQIVSHPEDQLADQEGEKARAFSTRRIIA